MFLRLAFVVAAFAHAAPAAAETPEAIRVEALALLRPYDGPALEAGSPVTDRTTLSGKVVTGYQGWFTAEGDGSGRGWFHYGKGGEFRPGRCSVDLWPDVSELGPDERFATPFRHADGRAAEVFSSYRHETVVRHFCWMAEYGIDAAFVQRFAVETRHPLGLRHVNAVLAHCREGANRHGRGYAVMYDLSGLRQGGVEAVIEDWKLLVDRMRLGRDEGDAAHLRHRGRPLVGVWGVGFGDGRAYTLAECDRLIDFLKSDPVYGGNAVLVGVPTGWRMLDRDAAPDPALHAAVAKADVVSPWTVGRYATPEDVSRHGVRDWRADLAWCRERGVFYLPVVFPGFSWSNLRGGSGGDAPLGQIPRLGGRFLAGQFAAAKAAGAEAAYVAMFDELDEGTAVFKCTNDVPAGESRFLDLEGLPSDFYLKLCGDGGRLLRGEIDAIDLPPRP